MLCELIMKKIVAGMLTVALMGLLLWSGRNRPAGTSPLAPGASPSSNKPDPAEARLATLLKTAGAGDLTGYLNCFTGPLRDRLEREVNERGRDVFTADLKRAAGSRKSHAIFAVEPEGPSAARIVVETVYLDRNERQTYHLTEQSGAWLVADVETIRSQVPKARYGTAATYQEPEGVPVQGLAVSGIPLRIETDLKPPDEAGTGTTKEQGGTGTEAPPAEPNP
jgi:hypothetical protein